MKKTYKFLVFIIAMFIVVSVFFNKNINYDKLQASVTMSSNTFGKIHFINVSNGPNVAGDAIVLESMGKICLVDTANPAKLGNITYTDSDGAKVANYIKNKIGATKIDCIIITHNHTDHIGGVKQIVNSGLVTSSTKYYYRAFDNNNDKYKADNKTYYDIALNSIKSKTSNLIEVTDKNISFTLGNFNIRLMNNESWTNKGYTGVTSEENDNSILEYVTIGNKSVLLTGDIESRDEIRMVNNKQVGKVNILKLGHHGNYTSSSYEFLDATKPDNVIISGNANYYPPERNIAALKYLKDVYKKDVYITSKVADAIVVTFSGSSTSASYTITNADGKTSINNAIPTLTYTTSGIWTKVVQENLSNRYSWYIFDSNSKSYRGWKKVGDYWYYLQGGNGALIKGLKKYEGYYYYLNPSTTSSTPEGAALSGWQKINDTWYYFTPTKLGNFPANSALTGFQTINSRTYYFDTTGKMIKGWKKINNEWYYMNPTENSTYKEGEVMLRWQTINGSSYFFDPYSSPAGKMMQGFRTISNKLYYFTTESENSSNAGKMIKNTTKNGFTFGSDGAATNFNGKVSKPTALSHCKTTTYNGSNQTITNSASTGYTFSNNSKKDAGSYTVKAKLTTGYLWSNYTADDVTFSCSIAKANLSNSTITSISDKTYTGSAIKPNPVVKMTLNGSSVTLTKDTDYTVTYSNNTNLGTATVTVTGKGNFTGTKSTTFKINPDSSHLVDKPTNSYCSGAIYKGSSQTITKSAGTGYTFSNNTGTNVGSYTVTAKLKTNYRWKGNTSGDVQFTCTIGAKNISNIDISMQNQQYDGTAKTPIPVVKDGSKTLTANTDYIIGSYSNNTNVGTASLTITGKGNYTGTATGTFEIISSDTPFYIKDTTYMKLEDNRINTKLKSGINSINRTSFLNNINSSSTWIPYNKSGSEITSGTALMTTGSYIKNGNTEYMIVIYGDINQDGLVTIKDLYQSYLLFKNKQVSLDEYQRIAADYDKNGSTNIIDVYQIYKKMKE